jgi:hypothetical protein
MSAMQSTTSFTWALGPLSSSIKLDTFVFGPHFPQSVSGMAVACCFQERERERERSIDRSIERERERERDRSRERERERESLVHRSQRLFTRLIEGHCGYLYLGVFVSAHPWHHHGFGNIHIWINIHNFWISVHPIIFWASCYNGNLRALFRFNRVYVKSKQSS